MIETTKLNTTLYGVAISLFAMSGSALAQPTVPAGEKLVNAATPAYGVRVNVDAAPGVFKNREISPDVLLDGNAHSRFLVTGAPYTIKVELPFKVMIEALSLTQSDYANEAAPKELEITFDDGQKITKTLALLRPQIVNRRPEIQWQDIPIGREIKSVNITVLSTYAGDVNYGGLGDLALRTGVNLDEKFRIPGYDAAAPVFVRPTGVGVTAAPVKVTLPPVAAPGEHPRLLFTPTELKAFAAQLPTTARGKTTQDGFLRIADSYAGMAAVFPQSFDSDKRQTSNPIEERQYRAEKYADRCANGDVQKRRSKAHAERYT
jgi:hypothetical protein